MFKTDFLQPHPLLQSLPDLRPLLVLSARLIDAVNFAIVQTVSLVSASTVVALLRDCIAALRHGRLFQWHKTVAVYLPLLTEPTGGSLLPGFAFAGWTRLTVSAPDGTQPT